MTTKKATKSKSDFDYRTIKNYEDACKKENHDPEKIPDVSMIPEEFGKPIIALFKIMMFYKAINNGVKMRMGDSSQNKYYPWPYVLSSGFGFSLTLYYYDITDTSVGSRLCTDSSEKALYAFKQCEDLYKDWML